MRAERTEWFENRNPFLPEVQALLTLGVFLPVDGVDELNRKIVVIRAAVHDPQIHLQNDVFKVYIFHYLRTYNIFFQICILS